MIDYRRNIKQKKQTNKQKVIVVFQETSKQKTIIEQNRIEQNRIKYKHFTFTELLSKGNTKYKINI